MKRVLVLNERDPGHPRAGGAEVHVDEIFQRLAARGHAVTIASSTFAGAAASERLGEIDVRRVGALPFYYPRAAALCARATRRGEFDVVVECLNKLPFLSPVYARRPVVVLCHHLFGSAAFLQVAWPIAATVFCVEQLVPRLYRREAFVAISESTRDDLVRRGVDAARIEVQHPGIDPPAAAPVPLRERVRRVVYVGRLEPYKNVDVLIRALAGLDPDLADTELVVIGEGSDRRRLERIAAEAGIAARTRFTGFVSREERDRWIAGSRVCVCPSAKEGWGLTVIESNALGVPNVATDAPGLRDSVRDGETGFLIAQGDVAGFRDRIARLLRDDVLAARMAERALAWSRGFAWDAAADRMEATLKAATEAS